jgi:uncharacterized damage-inducible protein DinB
MAALAWIHRVHIAFIIKKIIMNHTVTEIHRPEVDEYHKNFRQYVESVEGEDIIAILSKNRDEMVRFLESIGWEKWEHAYSPGKWTLAQLLVHLIDFERIFAYRALRIARNDKTPLAGFEQEDLAAFSEATQRLPASIVKEYKAVREATIQLFVNFTDEMWDRRGTAGGYTFTPLAIANIIAGHELHHRKLITERYL